MSTTLAITASPLTRESYAPFGEVIGIDESMPHLLVNDGTAKRYNHVFDMKNLRESDPDTRCNQCFFVADPACELPFQVQKLERHAFSTQAFLPVTPGRVLILVALGEDRPDLTTLSAFITENPQGVSYNPGVWHHPLIALDQKTTFFCLVFENGVAEEDCNLVRFDASVAEIQIP